MPVDLSIVLERFGPATRSRRPWERLAALVTEVAALRAALVASAASENTRLGCLVADPDQDDGWRYEEGSAGTPVARVVMVTATDEDVSADSGGVPAGVWAPLVVLAYDGRGHRVADAEHALAEAHPGCRIVWVDLADPVAPDIHPLWPCGRRVQGPVDVLTPSGELPPMLVERYRGSLDLRALSPTDLADGSANPRDLIIVLAESWVFDSVGGQVPRPSLGAGAGTDAASSPTGQKRTRYAARIRDALLGRTGDVLLSLKPRKGLADLHEEIRRPLPARDQVRLLFDSVQPPLAVQLTGLSERTSNELTDLGAAASAPLPDDADLRRLRAELVATEGAERASAAAGDGEIKAELGRSITRARARIARFLAYGFERIHLDIVTGVYPGTNGEPSGEGSRQGPPWIAKAEWMKASPYEIPALPKRYLDRHETLESSPEVRAMIGGALSKHLHRELTYLSLSYELLWETLVRQELLGFLRRELYVDSRAGHEPAAPLPLRHASDAGERARNAVESHKIIEAVKRWPEAEKVPARFNLAIISKSFRALITQCLKLGAALLIASPFLNVEFTGWNTESALGQVLCNPGAAAGLLALVLGLAFIMAWLGLEEVRAKREPMIDALRDKTHDAIEKAAIERLKTARAVFEQVAELDLRELEVQLSTQADNVLGERANRAQARAAKLRAMVAKLKEGVKQAEADLAITVSDRDTARKSAAAMVRKLVDLKAVQEGA